MAKQRISIHRHSVKPCPFCGSDDIGVASDDGLRWYYVECNECGARGPEERGEIAPLGSWDKRIEINA